MKNSRTALVRLMATLLCLLLALTTACAKTPNDDKETTTTGEITEITDEEGVLLNSYENKIVGSKRLGRIYDHISETYYHAYTETFEDMVNIIKTTTEWHRFWKESDGYIGQTNGRIVIGRVEKVIDVVDIGSWGSNSYEEDPDFEPEFEGDTKCYDPEHATVYNIIVEETLFGDETETLKLYLYGTPDSPLGTTKPEIGDNLLLLLMEDEKGYCSPVGHEKGMFRINGNGTVYSFHDDEVTAQFDSKSASVLEDKILEILGEKFIGSDHGNFGTYSVPSTFEELVTSVEKTSSDTKAVIVTGKVESVINFLSDSGITYYRFHVDKTLYGKESSWLKLRLFGSPNSNVLTTKPNVGDNLLLVLWSDDGENYSLISYERSMFRINDDGTVYSFHNDEMVAQFDGKSIEFLESAIIDVLKG